MTMLANYGVCGWCAGLERERDMYMMRRRKTTEFHQTPAVKTSSKRPSFLNTPTTQSNLRCYGNSSKPLMGQFIGYIVYLVGCR